MRDLTAWIVALLMISFGLRYAFQVYKKEISPALSTWVILFTGVFLSLLSYAAAENRDFKSGILNTVDLAAVVIAATSIILWGKTSGVRFKPFEKKYLKTAGIIVVFWIISQSAFISNLLIQVLMISGYFPTIQNLITEGRNTESFSAWTIVMFAALFALYPALIGGNLLAGIYVGKTVVMVGAVLSFMTFYHFKNR